MSWYSQSKLNVRITPEMARDVVDRNRKAVEEGKHRQRPVSDSNKQRLKAAMVGGGFINNGDPIIFDENGYILEGQHRLAACAESGVTIYLDVRVTSSAINGIKSIETYGGKPRAMHIRMFLADGIDNAKRLASLANMLSFVGTRRTVTLDIGQSRAIIDLFRKEIETMLPILNSGQKETRTWFVGPLIWAAKANRDAAIEFATRYTTMENVPAGHPALALRIWISNRNIQNGFGGREVQMDAVCGALRTHFEGGKLKRITSCKSAHDWLLAQSKGITRKVNEITFPPELLKLAA